MGLASAATAASETEPRRVQASERDVQETAGRVEKAAGAATQNPVAPTRNVHERSSHYKTTTAVYRSFELRVG